MRLRVEYGDGCAPAGHIALYDTHSNLWRPDPMYDVMSLFHNAYDAEASIEYGDVPISDEERDMLVCNVRAQFAGDSDRQDEWEE